MLVVLLALSVGQDSPALAISIEDRGHLLGDSMLPLHNLADLPDSVANELSKHLGRNPMANPGQDYASSCVSSSKLPLRRLMSAWYSAAYCLLLYESGGKSHLIHLAFFKWSPEQAALRWTGVLAVDKQLKKISLGELRDCIQKQQFMEVDAL